MSTFFSRSDAMLLDIACRSSCSHYYATTDGSTCDSHAKCHTGHGKAHEMFSVLHCTLHEHPKTESGQVSWRVLISRFDTFRLGSFSKGFPRCLPAVHQFHTQEEAFLAQEHWHGNQQVVWCTTSPDMGHTMGF